ncbi:hypothetical protein [uncultured Pontibacter sp.]|uniref:hypothetical protein n=1 Tax=uncultured Pontibacter sp. TaxID=453356 RepID=UPI002635C5F2|nr:hypothetical protein [uncultured Pontibacter sp.]
MNRNLTQQEVEASLTSGKTIEVFLGRISDDSEIISWLDLQKTKDNLVEVTCYEVYDEGNLEWLDLYAFSFVDPDMEFESNQFETVEEAIRFIKGKYRLTEPKFLTRGAIQTEYENLLIAEGRN